MSQFELTMPKMGESVAEATIIKWLKNEGEHIKLDEPVLEIATDKVDSEIPSPFEGILVKKLFNEGEVIQVGSVIALIGSGVSSADSKNVSSGNETKTNNQIVSTTVESDKKLSEVTEIIASNNDHHSSNKFYSPLVKNIAKQEGISVAELDSIAGSGKD
ncbi:MAG: biotin/lipoyl-containing protein, partial [Bacteroidota bacterium]